MRPFAPGSSPLTQGKRRVFRRSVGVRRLIPAHAGKTSSPQCTRSAYRLIPAHAGKTVALRYRRTRLPAHPRSRGENVVADTKKFSRAGSSPLTRGKLLDRRVGLALQRLIPAHAGKTASAGTQPESRAAHPRSRGENRLEFAAQEGNNGSSPLTRGKPVEHLRDRRPRRLIPAHAGKTRTRGPTHRRTKAHPRSRGENRGPHAALFVRGGSSPLTRGKPNRRLSHRPGSGSSPLTRGKLHVPRLAIPRGRLIPAHAGKTDRIAPSLTLRTAHPRSRGENAVNTKAVNGQSGSSPLTRGKQLWSLLARWWPRLIPAHAGKTCRPQCSSPATTAHPRSRGENEAARQPHGWETGSSPLTRGKQS